MCSISITSSLVVVCGKRSRLTKSVHGVARAHHGGGRSCSCWEDRGQEREHSVQTSSRSCLCARPAPVVPRLLPTKMELMPACATQEFGWCHLSAGDLLRAERATGSQDADLINTCTMLGLCDMPR